MNIKPLADRVLVLPAPAEERTIGGIIIPDSAKEKPLKGTVVAVGNGTKDEEMVVSPMTLYSMANMPAQSWNLKAKNTSLCVSLIYWLLSNRRL